MQYLYQTIKDIVQTPSPTTLSLSFFREAVGKEVEEDNHYTIKHYMFILNNLVEGRYLTREVPRSGGASIYKRLNPLPTFEAFTYTYGTVEAFIATSLPIASEQVEMWHVEHLKSLKLEWDKKSATALEKEVEVLRYLRAKGPRSTTEIRFALNIGMTTASKLCNTLLEHGLIARSYGRQSPWRLEKVLKTEQEKKALKVAYF